MTTITSSQGRVPRRALRTAAAVLAMGLVLAACGSGGGGSSAPKKGGSIYFAEGPGASPNYIFPYMGCSYFSVSNINQFQFQMYRPLYWFGLGSSTAVQYSLSPAKAPVFSDGNKTITINMKNWKFSDGTTGERRVGDVLLEPLQGRPHVVLRLQQGLRDPRPARERHGSGSAITLTFKTAVNPTGSCTTTSPRSARCPRPGTAPRRARQPDLAGAPPVHTRAAATDTDCKAVETFLDGLASKTTTYTGTSGRWSTGRGSSRPSTSWATRTSCRTRLLGTPEVDRERVYHKAYTTTTCRGERPLRQQV